MESQIPEIQYQMKLYLIFAVIDLVILLAYPVVYLIHRVRKIMKARQ